MRIGLQFLLWVGLLMGCAASLPAAANTAKVLPRVPDDMKPIAQEAAEAYASGKFEDAVDCYQEILESYPDSLYAQSNLGVVLYQMKEYDESVAALERAVKLGPKDAFSWAILGFVYTQKGDLKKARAALEKSRELDPKNIWAARYMPLLEMQQSWWHQAAESMKREQGEADVSRDKPAF